MKIVNKLILGFLLIVSLIWFAGYMAVDVSRKALLQSITNSSLSLAIDVLEQIDKDIYTHIENMQEYSLDLIMQDALKRSNQEFAQLEDVAALIESRDAEWVTARPTQVTSLMKALSDNELAKELREKQRYYRKKYGFGSFGEFLVTNKYGALVAQTGVASDYQQNDESWWQTAKQKGLSVEDVEYDESADMYSLAISVRVENEQGEFSGVIKEMLNIKEVLSYMDELVAGMQQYGYSSAGFHLITQDSKIIYSNQGLKLLEPAPSQLVDLDEAPLVEQVYAVKYTPSAYHAVHVVGSKLYVHARSSGYREYSGLGWILNIEHPTAEVFAPVGQLERQVLIFGILACVAALIVLYLVSRAVVGPIEALRSITHRIAKGELGAQVVVQGNDEIGELAADFNWMTQQLQEITVSQDELMKEVEERRCIEKELRGAKVAAEESSRIKSEIVANISHEIRTPLNGILGMAELLQDTNLDEEQREYMEIIGQSGWRLLDLINDILNFSKAEAGTLELNPRDFDLERIACDVVQLLSGKAAEKELKLTLHYALGCPQYLSADAEYIQQILLHLVSNAIKFTGKGSVLIDITGEEQTGERASIHLAVQDTGIGIMPDVQDKLFDSFAQVDTSATRQYGGVGLGLAICKQLVNLMDGEIGVESVPGEGSIFWVTLSLPLAAVGHSTPG